MDNIQDTVRMEVEKQLKAYRQDWGFTDRKLTDTPTDALAVVPRKYVTMNGLTRPTSSVVGQFFLDMNLASGRGKAIWWNGTGWVDGTGAYV